MNNKDPLGKVEKPKRKKYACLEMERTYEHPGTECLYFTQDLWGRGRQDNEVIKDRFIRMQMMKDAQSGRMNPQARSGLIHKLNNNLGHSMLISMVNSIHKAGNKWNQAPPELLRVNIGELRRINEN